MADLKMYGEPTDSGRRHPAIKDLATEVFDNGRRGTPKPGCDCIQCFGYCMVDQDAYLRETATSNAGAAAVRRQALETMGYEDAGISYREVLRAEA